MTPRAITSMHDRHGYLLNDSPNNGSNTNVYPSIRISCSTTGKQSCHSMQSSSCEPKQEDIVDESLITPHENDVLLGRCVPSHLGGDCVETLVQNQFPFLLSFRSFVVCRGGKNNQHSGNEKLRIIAREEYGSKYKMSSKKEKSAMSRELVRQMRDLEPPARYVIRMVRQLCETSCF